MTVLCTMLPAPVLASPPVSVTVSPSPAASPLPTTVAPTGGALPSALKASIAACRSVQITASLATGGTVRMIVDSHGDSDLRTGAGPVEMRMIRIGTKAYVRFNDGPWSTIALPPTFVSNVRKSMVDDVVSSTVTVLPDQVIDGVAVGTYKTRASLMIPSMTGAMPAASGTPTTTVTETTCIYDKTTMLLRSCSIVPDAGIAPMTMVYSHWNDPANVVKKPF